MHKWPLPGPPSYCGLEPPLMSSAGFGLTMAKEQTQGQVLDSGGIFVCSISAIYLFIL